MEQFEKEWVKFDCKLDCHSNSPCHECELIAEIFYRKALEWVLAQMDATPIWKVNYQQIENELED